MKLTLTYPASTGRNVDEILRVLDSLQLTAEYTVATPVNWKDGEDVIIVPAVTDDEAKAKFPKGFKIKDYLRFTPQPNKCHRGSPVRPNDGVAGPSGRRRLRRSRSLGRRGPRPPGPVFAQFALEDLALGVAGQRVVRNTMRVGTLKRASVARRGGDLLGRDLAPRAEHDDRRHLFAERGVRDADDRAVGDAGCSKSAASTSPSRRSPRRG